ncbi:TPA: hypothetical protein ACKP07_005006 [Serratia marcescens]|uniref:hypothetical protein n=1 Tax=Serratia marcescens TaxID=615 RepID=UPI00339C6F07
MGMIYKRGWQRTLSRHELEKMLRDENVRDTNKVVTLLLGEDWQNFGPFTIVDNSWVEPDATFIQRINRLWFVPIYLLTIPFQWLFRGRVGVETNSKLGALMSKLTGLK